MTITTGDLRRLLPRRTRLRLWLNGCLDATAIWLVEHDHFRAAERLVAPFRGAGRRAPMPRWVWILFGIVLIMILIILLVEHFHVAAH